jgi:hypothetical protein
MAHVSEVFLLMVNTPSVASGYTTPDADAASSATPMNSEPTCCTLPLATAPPAVMLRILPG